MTVPAGLSFVTVGARDLAALRRFYVDGLGWTPWHDGDDFLAFDLGGTKLGFYAIDALAREAGAEPPAPGAWSGTSLACNAATRDGVDGLWQAWVDAGATPVAEPADRPYGPRSGYVADPEGNRWEIAWADGVEGVDGFDGAEVPVP